jgi:hypothetical protein
MFQSGPASAPAAKRYVGHHNLTEKGEQYEEVRRGILWDILAGFRRVR